MDDAQQTSKIQEGRYLYCIVNNTSESELGEIGLDRNSVYTISYGDISALTHDCLARPYESKEEEKAKSWLFSHLYVIDVATKKFGTVVPFAFDTIIKGNEDNVREWLSKEYSRLKSNLEKLKDKAEYDIQIFLDVNSVNQKIENTNEEIQKLKKGIETKPKGVAHMLQKKFDMIIKNELRKKAEEYSNKIHDQVKKYAEGTEEEKIIKIDAEKWKDKEMILNLSCLVHNSNIKALGNILEQINNTDELSVRFSGPWSPFNFVS